MSKNTASKVKTTRKKSSKAKNFSKEFEVDQASLEKRLKVATELIEQRKSDNGKVAVTDEQLKLLYECYNNNELAEMFDCGADKVRRKINDLIKSGVITEKKKLGRKPIELYLKYDINELLEATNTHKQKTSQGQASLDVLDAIQRFIANEIDKPQFKQQILKIVKDVAAKELKQTKILLKKELDKVIYSIVNANIKDVKESSIILKQIKQLKDSFDKE